MRTQFQICHSIIVGEKARSETSLFIILVPFSLLRSSANYIACLSTSPSPLSSFISMFQNVSHLDKYNIYMKVTENNGFMLKMPLFLHCRQNTQHFEFPLIFSTKNLEISFKTEAYHLYWFLFMVWNQYAINTIL